MSSLVHEHVPSLLPSVVQHVMLLCRDLLYFTNISLCIFNEPTSGYYLDGKFMEPRSDDSLQKLTRNLEKQRAGSILRKVESQLVFVGTDMYDAYTLKKQDLCRSPTSPTTASRAAALLSTLKSFMEDTSQVRILCSAPCRMDALLHRFDCQMTLKHSVSQFMNVSSH